MPAGLRYRDHSGRAAAGGGGGPGGRGGAAAGKPAQQDGPGLGTAVHGPRIWWHGFRPLQQHAVRPAAHAGVRCEHRRGAVEQRYVHAAHQPEGEDLRDAGGHCGAGFQLSLAAGGQAGVSGAVPLERPDLSGVRLSEPSGGDGAGPDPSGHHVLDGRYGQRGDAPDAGADPPAGGYPDGGQLRGADEGLPGEQALGGAGGAGGEAERLGRRLRRTAAELRPRPVFVRV